MNDRDIRSDVRPRCERPDASLRVDAHAVAEQVDQRSELLRAHEDVDLWEPLLERVGLGPDHAAHEGDDLFAVLLLHRLEVTEHPDHLVLRALPDDAAVQDHHVGLFGARGLAQAHLFKGAFEALGIGHVHLAADCPYVIVFHVRFVGGLDEWRREWDSNPRERFLPLSA